MFNKDNASKYVAANSDQIILSGIFGKSQTAKLLIDNASVMFGVKGETAILKLSTTAYLQNGANCGRNPVGDVNLSDKTIKANVIKDNQNLCPKILYNTYHGFQALKAGAYNGTELDEQFANYISDLRATLISGEVEKILWMGDTASTNNNLKRFDGIIKQLNTTPVEATGTDVIEKLQFIINSTNIDLMSNPDFAVFIGFDTYQQYKMKIANKNLYHESGTGIETIFGTTIKLIPVSGLNGTGLVVTSRISNFVLATDNEQDMMSVKFRYDEGEDIYHQDFIFSIGIGIAYPEEVGVYEI